MKNYKRFRLHVGVGMKEYYQVIIFDDRMSMRMFSAQLLKKMSVSKMEAATHSFKAFKMVNGKEVESDMIGSILFYKDGFSHGVVAHEIAHAVNYYFLRNKTNFNLGGKINDRWRMGDEAYATMLGYMVNKFWKKVGHYPGRERY